MANSRVHGVQRVLSKLESSINAGNYYEAHQMYRTLYFRYLGQKKYGELLDLLYDGAILLLKHDQQTSGADLAILLVDVLIKSEASTSEELFSKLSRLFGMISSDVPERETFLANALQWSIKGSQQFKSGHPQLHQSIAQIFWKEKNYTLARYHFLHSTDGSGCATMLVELHRQRGYSSEVDLFIAQAVLQYLCLHNKTSAKDVFDSYTTQHPNIKKTGPPYILPLLNFIWFLLKVVESGKLAAFTVLCREYQTSIERDPCYIDYLDKIAQIFFGVPPPRPRNQGLFGNLLQSFLSGLDDSDSEDESQSSHPRASTSRQHMETDELD
ncbi:Golgi to ER traffic protein 4 homolog [Periplaneta americana]|uniref:Golgi to ER traffic protein 4 homolog n=1 Tax=Periplaneta americana TaxID=6978 RepID=UPI0037E736CB